MMKVSYAGASFLTTDAVAVGLFKFVAALGANHEAESLQIPAFNGNGKPVLVQMVLGPASELIGVPEDSLLPEPDNIEFLAELSKRTNALSTPRPVVDSELGFPTGHDWEDLDSL